MAWADEAAQASQKANTLVVLAARHIPVHTLVDANHNGGIIPLYSMPFELGYPRYVGPPAGTDPIISELVIENGTALEWPLENLSTMPVSRWAFDPVNKLVYTVSANPSPPEVLTFVIIYELYFGSKDTTWHRRPLDPDTEEVYFEPAAISTPVITRGTSSDAFGIVPTQGGTLSIECASGLPLVHLKEASFNNTPCAIYSWLGDIRDGNIRRIFSGSTNSFTYSGDTVDFRIVDHIGLLSGDLAVVGQTTQITASIRPNGTLQQRVFGRVDGVVGVAGSPAFLGGPVYGWEIAGQNPGYVLGNIVAASPASTTTRTYLNSVTGLDVDDSIWASDTAGTSADTVRVITAIDRVANYIEHAAFPAPLAAGKTVGRAHISYVDIFQNGVAYRASYRLHYNLGPGGVVFVSTIQADLGLPNQLDANSQVSARVYGERVGQSGFFSSLYGVNDARTGCLSDPALITFQVLVAALNISDTGPGETRSLYLDEQSFIDAIGVIPWACGAVYPDSVTQTSMGPAIDALQGIIESGFIRVFVTQDGKFAIKVRQALPATPSRTIDETGIVEGSLSYSFDYQDIFNRVDVRYAAQKLDPNGEESYQVATVQNYVINYLHGVSTTKTVDSKLIYSDQAEEYAARYLELFSYPLGLLTIQTRLEFADVEIGDAVRVSLERMPGYEVLRGTERQTDFSVSEVSVSRTGVTLVLDDQRGIEENSGDW